MLADQLFSHLQPVTGRPQGTTTWRMQYQHQVAEVFGSIFEYHPNCYGVSRPIKKPSETVVRVVATLIGDAEISHVTANNGNEKLGYTATSCACLTPAWNRSTPFSTWLLTADCHTTNCLRCRAPHTAQQSSADGPLGLLQARTKLKGTAIKLELVGRDYEPKRDTCLKAFIRLLAHQNNVST